jgi:hypothetical protein
MESVTTRHEVTTYPAGFATVRERKGWTCRFEDFNDRPVNVEENVSSRRKAGGNDVLNNFALGANRNRPPDKVSQINVMAAAIKAQIDPVMP